MMYHISEEPNGELKKQIARFVLEQLPEWFEVPESRENYIQEATDKPFFCARHEGEPVGFLYLKETGRDTVELAVMGVLKEHHRHGAGRQLFQTAKLWAQRAGYSFMQVKTVKMGLYEDYDKTNRFYQALGFKELEVFPSLWDELNPCQIYIMALTAETGNV